MAWREKKCSAKVDDLDARGPFPFRAPAWTFLSSFISSFFHYVLSFPPFLHYVLRLEIQVDYVTIVQVFNLARNRIIGKVIDIM